MAANWENAPKETKSNSLPSNLNVLLFDQAYNNNNMNSTR